MFAYGTIVVLGGLFGVLILQYFCKFCKQAGAKIRAHIIPFETKSDLFATVMKTA